MNNLILVLKGFLIGVAKIIPGVSGAILSISLGIYERVLNIVGHPLKIGFDDIKFLFYLMIGALGGILFFCFCVQWCLNKWQCATMLLFVGLIIGGIPEILDVVSGRYDYKNWIILIVSFMIVIIITNLSSRDTSSSHYFLMGCVESMTTIIPGISGTAIFMALGWYESVLQTMSSVLTFSAPFSVSFYYVTGFIISTIIISRVLNFAFINYKVKSYFCVIGFMFGSLFIMFRDIVKIRATGMELVFGVFLFIIGILSTNIINRFFSKL